MISVTVVRNETGKYIGFSSTGHADYDVEGRDIVCSAVSVLSINLVNSLETLASARSDVESRDGYISYRLISEPTFGTELLFKSYILGIRSIIDEYGTKYIKYSEVK